MISASSAGAGITQEFRPCSAAVHVIGAIQPNRELIAAETRDEVGRTKCLAKQGRGAAQDLIAGFVAEPVLR